MGGVLQKMKGVGEESVFDWYFVVVIVVNLMMISSIWINMMCQCMDYLELGREEMVGENYKGRWGRK